jgi:hypothetical protein
MPKDDLFLVRDAMLAKTKMSWQELITHKQSWQLSEEQLFFYEIISIVNWLLEKEKQ